MLLKISSGSASGQDSRQLQSAAMSDAQGDVERGRTISKADILPPGAPGSKMWCPDKVSGAPKACALHPLALGCSGIKAADTCPLVVHSAAACPIG